MKTKKTIMSTVMTALILAGCSKDEVSNINNRDDANIIGFELSTGKTKAHVVDLDALQLDADGFGVFATNGATSKAFINNSAYRYNTTTYFWGWVGNKVKWPEEAEDYPINFYAYYPFSSASLNVDLNAVYIVAGTPEAQVDLLAANHIGIADRPVSSDVSLAFKHILSKIDFRVVTSVDITVEVQSIAVRKVGNQGTFNFSSLTWTSSPGTWSSGYNYMTAPVIPDNKFVDETNPKNVTGSSGSLMLMPQDLSTRKWDKTVSGLNSQSYIEVVYRMYETTSRKDIVGYTDATKHPEYSTMGSTVTGPLFVKVGYPLPTNWLMSKAYAYTVYLNEDSSGGNLIEENFIDEDGDDSGLPVVNPETEESIDKPSPIFPDQPIGFNVNVDNWGTEVENPIQ